MAVLIDLEFRLLQQVERETITLYSERDSIGNPLLGVSSLVSHRLANPVDDPSRRKFNILAAGISLQDTEQQVVDDLRRQLALRYVKNPRIRLSQLGFLLGFSENAAFVHAFRRWTGSTPMRYRAANGGDHASAATRPPALAHGHRPAPTP